MTKVTSFIIVLLLAIIGFLAWALLDKPVEAPTVVPPTNVVQEKPVTVPLETPATKKALHTQIVITYPMSGAEVPKTFTVKGNAPGNWFFEASAPVMVQAEDGSKIASGLAKVAGDWMTTELVSFTADVTINPAYSGPATLVLLKDNPSGLPENDDSLEIPIVVK